MYGIISSERFLVLIEKLLKHTPLARVTLDHLGQKLSAQKVNVKFVYLIFTDSLITMISLILCFPLYID